MNFFKSVGRKVALINKGVISNVAPGEREDDVVTKKQMEDAITDVASLTYDEVITAAEFKTIYSNPITLIASPGSGKMIVPTSDLFVVRLAGTQEFNWSGLFGAVDFGIVYNVADYFIYNAFAYPFTIPQQWIDSSGFAKRANIFPKLTGGYLTIDIENKPLILTCTLGNATQGNCNVRLIFSYKIIDI